MYICYPPSVVYPILKSTAAFQAISDNFLVLDQYVSLKLFSHKEYGNEMAEQRKGALFGLNFWRC